MPALRLFLLGPFVIRHEGHPLAKPPTLKSQSLFAYLALHRRQPQPRERLAALFWGDRPERRARRSLTTALWHIRRCLPDENSLLADVHAVQFDPQADLWLDVAEFEARVACSDLSSLQAAAALYRGDFLEGFYDDWVLNERYRLETLFSEALARLMRGLEARGDHEDALAIALRLLQHDPLREDAHRLAMRALCHLGQRDAALAQYRRCQQIVAQELDAEPMTETAELHQAILDGRFAVTPLARRLYAETEGNPFFLMEMVKALFEAGLVRLEAGAWQGDFAHVSGAELPLPVGLSEAIQARVGRLGGEARQALQVAAMLGREFDFDLLCAAWGQAEEATLGALDALLRRRFVDEGSGSASRDYVFHHHKIREVVYAGIPLRHRRRLHARAGEAVETCHTTEMEEVAGELAFHFCQGRHVDRALEAKAIRYLLLAGDQARLAYAHCEAIDFYNQALALQKERDEYEGAGRTLMKLGLAYHTRFDFAQARRAFEEGFAQRQQVGRQELSLALPPAPHALRIRWRRPYTLDPGLCAEYVSTTVVEQLFSGLVSTAPDLDVVPEVAQGWQVLEGGRHYRFHLSPNARWSDGTPVTAHDFEYAWKRVLHSAVGADASKLLAIKGARVFHQGEVAGAEGVGVQALDNRTLDVELEEPVSHFLYVLIHANACPVPRHLVEAFGASWTDVDKIVSNGPFCLEAWDRSEGMTLVQNPFYGGHRQGNVERVVLHFPQDPATQDLSAPLDQYAQGDLDVLTLTDAAVHEGDRIRRQFAAEYLSAPWLYTIYVGFVTSRPPFDDVRLRRAFALAADREKLGSVVLRGMYDPATGGFVPRGMPGHSPQIGYPYEPEQARQLLAAAGHAAGSGLPLLEALSVPPIDPLITDYLQAEWQENLGIRVSWDVVDWPPFQKRMEQDPPHLYILARFAGWPDPSRFLAADSIRQDTRWANQAYEQLIEEARHTWDQELRLGLLRQADRILVQEAPIVPLFYGRQHILIKPWVISFPLSALNHWYWKDTVIEPH